MPDLLSTRNATFRLLPLGDTALTVEFGNVIDPALNQQVIAFADVVRRAKWSGVLDVVPTYRSVTIHVDPLQLDVTTLSDRVREISAQALRESAVQSRTHHIPIIYGGEWGPDLEGVADFAKLSLAETIRLHCSVSYRVYMLGFSPGFPYMGIVPERIAMPRLATPRLAVPAGSVGIADTQTGIYPIATPGGWRLIGRTPIQLYRPGSGVPFLIKPGDWVRFEPITVQDFNRLLLAHHAETH
ncbi:5-oxoprolinase subunit PxpB [Petrachloros mirabilis]